MVAIAKRSGSALNCKIQGTIGRFNTPAGSVLFLQTRARLPAGTDSSDAARLTARLSPAREALDIKEMDFNQLLQRDLDDHRIAHELVPYILTPQTNGPAFFPPVLAALLPFQNRKPIQRFPELTNSSGYVDPDFSDVTWKVASADPAFRIQELEDDAGTALLRWNDDHAKLVIMDGQHRAMAMLAIYRTLTNSWGAASSATERYKPFYEAKILELLASTGAQNGLASSIEYPVTICVFPEATGDGGRPHSAARKLFVDVNKEARPPSDSRLILLSDTRLNHILARELLNALRPQGGKNGPNVPLFAVEYDNPTANQTTPRRWSALTNLETLLRCVDFTCFGPASLHERVEEPLTKKGKPNKVEKSLFFRNQMVLQNVLDETIEDGPRSIDRKEIGLDLFPIYNKEARRKLLERFLDLWGKGILRLLSEVLPYKAHVAALTEMHTTWLGGDLAAGLAREALFEGVGMFWTLESGHKHWLEIQTKGGAAAPTDVSKAWKIVDVEKRKAFGQLRARYYLDTPNIDDAKLDSCNLFYGTALTIAAQVGLIMTWATLRQANPSVEPGIVVDAMIECINNALKTGPTGSRTRRLLLSKEGDKAFNQLGKMDASFASFFRGFWLELFLCSENRERLREVGLNLDSVDEILARCRRAYLKHIVTQQEKHLGNLKPAMQVVQRNREATRSAVDHVASSYAWWFGGKKKEYQDMLIGLLSADDESDEQVEEDGTAASIGPDDGSESEEPD